MGETETARSVQQAIVDIAREVVTNRDSVLSILLDDIETAATRIERAIDAALEALGPGACEHDAPWADEIVQAVEQLREDARFAKYEAAEKVDVLHQAFDARDAQRASTTPDPPPV